MKVSALIVAAGASTRMQGIDKITYPLCGTPIIVRSCKAFEESEVINEYIVVASENNLVKVESLLPTNIFKKLKKVVIGGEQRTDSVRNGLQELAGADIVMIHDGARPLITQEIIRRGYDTILEHDACCCGIPMTDTIKQVNNKVIETTLNREKIWCAQTPQIFKYDLIMQAYSIFGTSKVTDDTMLVEQLGKHVVMFEGSKENIKITSPDDIKLATAIIKAREDNV